MKTIKIHLRGCLCQTLKSIKDAEANSLLDSLAKPNVKWTSVLLGSGSRYMIQHKHIVAVEMIEEEP